MLQPIGKRILIELIKEEQKGILILKNDSSPRYKVIAIGDEVTKVKPDDIIITAQYGLNSIKIDDQVYTVLEQESIIAKVV